MVEEWRELHQYRGNYLISSHGNLKRIYKRNGISYCEDVAPHKCQGYLNACLKKKSSSYSEKTVGIHRLVGEAFLGRIGKRKCINHMNNNPSDNRVENLEIVTYGENARHGAMLRTKINWIKGSCIKCLYRKTTGAICAICL